MLLYGRGALLQCPPSQIKRFWTGDSDAMDTSESDDETLMVDMGDPSPPLEVRDGSSMSEVMDGPDQSDEIHRHVGMDPGVADVVGRTLSWNNFGDRACSTSTQSPHNLNGGIDTCSFTTALAPGIRLRPRVRIKKHLPDSPQSPSPEKAIPRKRLLMPTTIDGRVLWTKPDQPTDEDSAPLSVSCRGHSQHESTSKEPKPRHNLEARALAKRAMRKPLNPHSRSRKHLHGAKQKAAPQPIAPLQGLPAMDDSLALQGARAFWYFVAQALLGPTARDSVCRMFELGGTIDRLGDVAFVRDEITSKYLANEDLESVVWNCLLISWLGAGGPDQSSFKLLRDEGYARSYHETSHGTCRNIYKRAQQLVEELGNAGVFDGDSRSVKFRLGQDQVGILEKWLDAVPRITQALDSGVSPEQLEKVLRTVYYIGPLTAKELFVHFSYARPLVADTTRYIPIGGGACDGARLVLSGGGIQPAAQPVVVRSAARKSMQPFGEPSRQVPTSDPDTQSCQASSCSGGKSVAGKASGCRVDPIWGPQAVHRIYAYRTWALREVPDLRRACEAYCLAAPHRDIPVCNQRVARECLIDLADIEVMCCYYKNYRKLKDRFGSGPLPSHVSVRGWGRRPPEDLCAASGSDA